ncbi:VOC family protein [Longispora sp. K20-0274]|uniref:VOC family protein n=1 Tax=Longispora sp. K20-0274 TaxID=3088255 RepID=UPI00399B7B6F
MTQLPTLVVRTVNFDCADAQAMARFYGGLLGWEPTEVEPDWVLMRDPAGGTGLSFQQDPGYVRPVWPEEPGRQQKMIHLEVLVTPAEGGHSEAEGQAALAEAVRLALSVGGTLADPQARPDLRVILDPAGHPLCLFLP